MSFLLSDLVVSAAADSPQATALVHLGQSTSYESLFEAVETAAHAFVAGGLQRRERVALFLGKQPEFVAAAFGASRAGATFVPINIVLKPPQVGHILRDCNVRVLVTTAARLSQLEDEIGSCPDLRQVLLVDSAPDHPIPSVSSSTWADFLQAASDAPLHRVVDEDMTAILYTSGSTGKPKGVVLSHRNMVVGARSVASYIGNNSEDRILAALPFSFDAGLSQLTTAIVARGSTILLDYLLPRDVLRALDAENVTGLTGVPPLWVQLAQLEWPQNVVENLRYIANTGGAMPVPVLDELRKKLPNTKPFLMYGLTEAFRSTYLPPEEIDRRVGSMGKAIPNAEVMVVREDGSECDPEEPGELVHRGALVSMGYWNDEEKTAERFKPAPGQPTELPMQEIAVWSGDTVKKDEDGFLYFVGRRDEMIKTSGYRVSPTEVEEVLFANDAIAEVAVVGVPHPQLGQAIVAVCVASDGADPSDTIPSHCAAVLPNYMMPKHFAWFDALPRNANGKIDRKMLSQEFQRHFADVN